MTVSILGPRGTYSVQAGAFRHRVTIQQQVAGKDSAGGLAPTWKDVAVKIPAAVEDTTGREGVNGQETTASVTSAISIRWRPNIDASMRILHTPKGELKPRIYNIENIQLDATGRKVMTMFCVRRDTDGFRTDGQ